MNEHGQVNTIHAQAEQASTQRDNDPPINSWQMWGTDPSFVVDWWTTMVKLWNWREHLQRLSSLRQGSEKALLKLHTQRPGPVQFDILSTAIPGLCNLVCKCMWLPQFDHECRKTAGWWLLWALVVVPGSVIMITVEPWSNTTTNATMRDP